MFSWLQIVPQRVNYARVLCCLLMIGTVQPVLAQNEYSEGLDAYIKGDYELAQLKWLEAAKQKNARAMFNLGLLHDQSKIANADPDKAARWFRLAGQEGYAPADFHYANRLIEQNEDQDNVVQYLERAAKNGYYPAQKKLESLGRGLPVAVAAVTKREAPVKPVGTEPKNNQSLKYLNESWIAKRSSADWTIQILAFQDEDKVREFIDMHRLHSRAAYFKEKSGGQILYKLVYGAYASKDQAAAVRDELTPALQEHGPWLRKLGSVQKVIAKQ